MCCEAFQFLAQLKSTNNSVSNIAVMIVLPGHSSDGLGAEISGWGRGGAIGGGQGRGVVVGGEVGWRWDRVPLCDGGSSENGVEHAQQLGGQLVGADLPGNAAVQAGKAALQGTRERQ